MALIFEADEEDPYPEEYIRLLDRVSVGMIAVMVLTAAVVSIVWTPAAISIGRRIAFALLFLYVTVLLAGYLRYSFDINAFRR